MKIILKVSNIECFWGKIGVEYEEEEGEKVEEKDDFKKMIIRNIWMGMGRILEVRGVEVVRRIWILIK